MTRREWRAAKPAGMSIREAQRRTAEIIARLSPPVVFERKDYSGTFEVSCYPPRDKHVFARAVDHLDNAFKTNVMRALNADLLVAQPSLNVNIKGIALRDDGQHVELE